MLKHNVLRIIMHAKHIRHLAARSSVPRLHPHNSFFFGRDYFAIRGEIVPPWTQKNFVGGCNGSSQCRSLASRRICDSAYRANMFVLDFSFNTV